MENEKEKPKSTILRCFAFGDLRPADICALCEDCETNAKFSENGGCPGMLLTGSRENLANALRAPGVAMNDVVVVNAKNFKEMCNLLDQLNRLGDGVQGFLRLTRIQSEAREILKTVRGEK